MKKSNQKPAPKFGESDYLDLALIASIKKGDQLAFRKMFYKYAPVLSKRYFSSFRTKDELKDVVSEIMMKAFQNIHRYEMNYTFNAWLTALARNYVVDYVRQQKTRVSNLNSISVDVLYNTDSGDGVRFDIPSDDPDAMVAKPEVERQAKLECIYEAIDNLPENSMKGFTKEIRDMFIMYKSSKFKKINEFTVEIQKEYENIREMFIKGFESGFADWNGSLEEFCEFVRKRYQDSSDEKTRIIGTFVLSKIEGWTLKQIFRRENIGVDTISSNMSSIQSGYEQAQKERDIMNMYLKENMPYEKIAKVMKMNPNSLKVTIMRAKQNIMGSINLRKAVVDIASKYTIEQLNPEMFTGSPRKVSGSSKF